MKTTTISALCVAGLFLWWFAIPAVNYHKGTSEGVSVEVIVQPFLGGPNLVYRWSGRVVQACPVEIRREIVDSANAVTRLTSRNFGRPSSNSLGDASYEVTIPVPVQIAEGPATYRATELPKCNWLQRLFPVAIDYPPVEFVVSR